MKKIILILSLILMAVSFCACGSSTSSTEDTENTKNTENTEDTESTEKDSVSPDDMDGVEYITSYSEENAAGNAIISLSMYKDTSKDISDDTDFVGIWDDLNEKWIFEIQEVPEIGGSNNYHYCGENVFSYETTSDVPADGVHEFHETVFIDPNHDDYFSFKLNGSTYHYVDGNVYTTGGVKYDDDEWGDWPDENSITKLNRDGSYSFIKVPEKFADCDVEHSYNDVKSLDAWILADSWKKATIACVFLFDTEEFVEIDPKYSNDFVNDTSDIDYDPGNSFKLKWLVGDNDNQYWVTYDLDGNVIDGPTVYEE